MNLAKVLERVAADSGFRTRLEADPAAALRESGVSVPPHQTVELIAAQANEIHLNLGGTGRPAELQAVLDRAASDAAFRQSLLTSPHAVLGKALGRDIPEAVRIRVHPPAADRLRIFLPPARPAADAELSDTELENAAGGGFFANVRERLCRDQTTMVMHTDGTYDAMVDTSTKATKESGDWFVW